MYQYNFQVKATWKTCVKKLINYVYSKQSNLSLALFLENV